MKKIFSDPYGIANSHPTVQEFQEHFKKKYERPSTQTSDIFDDESSLIMISDDLIKMSVDLNETQDIISSIVFIHDKQEIEGSLQTLEFMYDSDDRNQEIFKCCFMIDKKFLHEITKIAIKKIMGEVCNIVITSLNSVEVNNRKFKVDEIVINNSGTTSNVQMKLLY